MKKRFPFRFGTTSYIIPADIIPNVEFLSGKVDDIELVLFESEEFSNLPSPEDMHHLATLAGEADLTYSVHLPLDVYLGHQDRRERLRSAGKCRKIIDLTRGLPKSAYVLHFEAGPGIDINAFSVSELDRFTRALHDSCAMLLQQVDVPAVQICVENLNYPYELVLPVVEEYGFSVTLDVGHLEHYGFPTGEYLAGLLCRSRVLHMHGTRLGKDHNSLSCMKAETLDMVMGALAGDPMPDRVFTLEIFSEEDFFSSCRTMERFLQ
jgi:hypothetical protein